MSDDKCPCTKDCEERTVSPNCHTNCTAYKKWKAEKQKEKEKYDADRKSLMNLEGWLKYQQEGGSRK